MSQRASPSLEFRTPSRVWVLATFALAFVFLMASALLAFRQQQRALAGDERVRHTLIVQQQALELESDVLQMEVEHRGFLVRGDDAYLVRRDDYLSQARATLVDLRRLTRDNPRQQARLRQVTRMLDERVVRMVNLVGKARNAGIETARNSFGSTGKGAIRPLRDAIAELWLEESKLLSTRSQAASAQTRQLRWALALGPVTAMVLLCVGLVALLAQLNRMRSMAEVLRLAEQDARRALDLVDATHDGVLIYDAASLRFSYVNQGAIDQVGCTREELLSLTALDLNREYDEPRFRTLLAPLLAGEVATVALETNHRRKDGSDIPVEVSMQCVPLAGGAPSIVTVARDISARKRAEDERDRFFNLSLDMLCIASADGYFRRLSPAFTNTLGWSVEELLARPFLDFVHPDDRAATLVEVERQVVAGQPVLQFENRYRHKDGSWRVLSWKSAPQPDGHMYATARDVTERNLAEQRVVDLNRELTDRQTALEAANKDLEAFSYSVSHDLRAPLRHIDGYARMLLEDAAGLSADARRQLLAISGSSRRMGALIDDLLTFSRLGRQAITARGIDMTALARRALEELPDTDEAKVAIGSLPQAYGDPALLEQVWINLLSNALKYSAPRGSQRRIEVGGERDGTVNRYRVRDNGVGFDMRYADKLFGVFQRLHSQDDFEGTGVGLAIVQRILARHGGSIRAEAKPEQGATFIFELPIQEAEA